MKKIEVLYISGSLGLGHVSRDIAIADELRKMIPGIEISWLAVQPASMVLENAGEKILPEALKMSNENYFAEKSSKGNGLNLLSYLLKAKNSWKQNVNVFAEVVNKNEYDLVIGDETYEISLALRERKELKKFPFVMIYDFVGLDAMTKNPLEKFGIYIWNKKWAHDYVKKIKPAFDLGLFIGEPDDIPDKLFGRKLPNRRTFASDMYKFTGYAFPFDAQKLRADTGLRKRLGYTDRPFIIVSAGGTAIGKELLELCSRAFKILNKKMPSLRMIIVAGPRIALDTINVSGEVELKQYVPKLYEHFAACDLAIVQGGGASVNELTALKRPFIYFPVEGHCEQANIARILRERGAGVEMRLSGTTPELLADKIAVNLGAEVNYPEIPAEGAKTAAQNISFLLNRNVKNFQAAVSR